MFEATVENIEPDRIMRYALKRKGMALTYSAVLDLWQSDTEFRGFYNGLLANSPYPAFRWETPSLQKSSASQTFQFVLLNCPSFASRKTDHLTYRSYFTERNDDDGIASFMNLGGDARLVVPYPKTDIDAYGHFAAFVRNAPQQQRDAFWRVLGSTVKSEIGDKPLWVSTEGGGVAWLHVRLDSRPKYYGFSPFKTA